MGGLLEMLERVFRTCLVLIIIVDGINANNCTQSNISGYFMWRDLYCPDHCCYNRRLDECCACTALPCWEMDDVIGVGNVTNICGQTKGTLYVEYTGVFYSAVAVNHGAPSDVYELIHIGGLLVELPSNICDFADTLVHLDLRYNQLGDIGPISCLSQLDTLRLDNNHIQSIDNTTFSNMTQLRHLTLTHNAIADLEPNVVATNSPSNIFIVDMSNNHLDTVDITNVILVGTFCNVSYANSSVSALTNELDFQLVDGVMHGPGDINLEHTNLASFVNFSSLGVQYKDLGKNFIGSIGLDSSSCACDCGIYPLLTSLGPETGEYWGNLAGNDNVFCSSPPSMIGVDIKSIIANKTYDKLTCDLENCPYFGRCHCLDKPSDNKIIVNCTNAGLRKFPDEMPVGFWNNMNIDLILVNNYITELPNRDYMNRLVGLDLRGNSISSTNSDAVRQIPKTTPINMENQNLPRLISAFENKNPLGITFGDNPVECNCENLWIGDWVRLKRAKGRLMCKTKDGIVAAEKTTSGSLGCQVTVLPITSILPPTIIILFFTLVAAMLLFLKDYVTIFIRRFQKKDLVLSELDSDIFVSFHHSNQDAFEFVAKYLRPPLLSANYKLFIPFFDVLGGATRDDEISSAISKSHTYIVVLCHEYLQEYDPLFEFDCIWKNFKANKSSQIIIINLANLEPADISDRRIAAFCRLKMDISFRDRKGRLIDRLVNKLRPPIGLPSNAPGNAPPIHTPTEAVDADTARLEAYFMKPVHERLSTPKGPLCNCKFRQCYVHDVVTGKVKSNV